MNVGSLFAGIGGFDLGFERAGMRTLWQVEIDPFCRRVLERHFPDAERYEDVREVGAHNLASVDLICGGFPCQDISSGGRRAGIRASRSGLWAEMLRVVGELRPRYVVVENVADLAVRGLDIVVADLAALGYDAEWDCLPASAIGAPHGRDRVWIVAYPAERSLGDADIPSEDAYAKASRQWQAVGESGGWAIEPGVGRVADGIPAQVDRLRSLGNALVPQIAEWIGRRIMDHETRAQTNQVA